MSTVAEIEQAIQKLKPEEVRKIGDWLDELRERLWDQQIADGAVGVDEFGVDVAQKGAHPGKTVLEVEENRTAADERLEVAGDLGGEKFIELRE